MSTTTPSPAGPRPTCATCTFWHEPAGALPGRAPRMGLCRRAAPSREIDDGATRTQDTYWCGEHPHMEPWSWQAFPLPVGL